MNDLSSGHKLELDWSASNAQKSVEALVAHVISLADESVAWYIVAKNKKRKWARLIRVLAILLGALAAMLPTLGELFPGTNGASSVRAGWTAVLAGGVAALLLLDKFFGFSSAWMRYITYELQLRQIAQEFQLDWQSEKAKWAGKDPTIEQIHEMLARSKALVTQVNNLVREETTLWVREFEAVIKQVDEASKQKPAIVEPGALNLTVSNGTATSSGWTLSIDGGPAEQYVGQTAGKRNIIAGRHEIRVDGTINGRAVTAEKVITVPAGGTCEATLALA